MSLPTLSSAALLVAALATSLAAQPPRRTLDRPAAEYAEPFTNITAVRELRGGRVIVIDGGDRLVHLVDIGAGRAAQIGRQGAGPAEYRAPGTLLALPNDTTLVTDAGNQRLLVLAPDGTPAGVLTDAWPRGRGSANTRLPRAVDARVRGYFLGSAVAPRGDGFVQLDSAPLLRAARATEREDTLGYIHLAPRNISTTARGGTLTAVSIVVPPFPAQDSWQAFADGAVAIARVKEYRVDWVLPDGRRVAGPRLPHTPLRVTEGDKEEFRASRRGVTASAPGQPAPPPPPEPEWPEVKPPFPPTGAIAAPDGKLWVHRHTPAGDEVSRYDVIDRRGAIVGRVEIPNGGRVVGFGARSIYVSRKDADDLQYLQRFPL